MKDGRIRSELYAISHLTTLITITILSTVLIILDRMLGWEIWTIPVVVIGTVVCIGLHISGKGSPRMRIYIYGSFLIFEAFYYAVNISTVYDSTALVVIMAFIFGMTGERLLLIAGTFAGALGMGLHLLNVGSVGGLKLEPSNIIRVIWHFVLIFLAAMLAGRMSSAWNNTEKQYIRKIDEVIEENERVNNFLANVSHEIRTPINAVMGLAAIMGKEEIPDRIRGNVTAITEAGHRIADQIGDIMDYTEIDMKKLSVTGETYMMHSLVNDLMTQLRFTNDNGLDLVIDLSPDVPSELIGDGSKIRKILWHLISNGFKFTKSGGVYVHIFSKKRDYGVNLVLEVTDTGVGMTDDEIDHIYEKFYQSDSGRSRTAGGLGLGMPIVNGFARAMGGFLHIDSTPGQGTTVRVSVPQEVSDDTPCISVKNRDNIFVAGFLGFMTTEVPRVREFYMEMIGHLAVVLDVNFRRVQSRDELEKLAASYKITHLFVGTGEYVENREYIDSLSSAISVILVEDRGFKGSINPNIARLPKPFCGSQAANFLNHHNIYDLDSDDNRRMSCPGVRALVVDDEPMNLLVARGIFETYGMVVSTAPGGPESIEMCRVNDYDIIFMDHMMPGMDGVEAMKRIRLLASKEKKEVCIVALTANAISSAKEMFLSEGFDGFVPKPIELLELERVLKHVLPKSAIVYKDEDEVPAYTAPVTSEATSAPAEEKPARDDDTDRFAELRDLGVTIEEGMRYCQNDESFYKELLSEYAKERTEKVRALKKFFEDKNWKDYEIKVHAVKSTSKMIGAGKLSETARKLEAAAKAHDEAVLNECHPAFLPEYERLMEIAAKTAGVKTSSADEDGAPMEFSPGGPDGDDEIMEFAPGGGEI